MKRMNLPLIVNDQEVDYDQIYLLEVKWVSRGSIQPILGVRV